MSKSKDKPPKMQVNYEELKDIYEHLRREECGYIGTCSNGHPLYCIQKKGHMDEPPSRFLLPDGTPYNKQHALCGTGSQCTEDCVINGDFVASVIM